MVAGAVVWQDGSWVPAEAAAVVWQDGSWVPAEAAQLTLVLGPLGITLSCSHSSLGDLPPLHTPPAIQHPCF